MPIKPQEVGWRHQYIGTLQIDDSILIKLDCSRFQGKSYLSLSNFCRGNLSVVFEDNELVGNYARNYEVVRTNHRINDKYKRLDELYMIMWERFDIRRKDDIEIKKRLKKVESENKELQMRKLRNIVLDEFKKAN